MLLVVLLGFALPAAVSAAPRCLGKQATVAGQGEVRGTARADVIVGGPGRDSIFGGGGNDRICSGGGSDLVEGEVGSDRVDAGPGDDEVLGGNGSDFVLAGAGRDTVLGKRGNDRLLGGPGTDFLDSGLGDDELDGGPGDLDQVIGGVGNDRLAGGPGDGDLLRPDFGHDAIAGGEGAHDTVSFAVAGQGSVILGAGGVIVDLGAGTVNGESAKPDTVAGVEDVVGTAFADVITGSEEPNVLYGGGGIDDLVAQGPGDEARGGIGMDRCRGATAQQSCELPGTTPYSAASEASFLEAARTGGWSESRRPTLEVDLAGGAAAGSLTAVVDLPLTLERKPGIEVTVGIDANAWVLSARGIAIGVGDGCETLSAETARCALGGLPEAVLLSGSSGDDVLRIDPSVPATVGAVLNGFQGTDTIEGGAGDDSLDGYVSGGADVLRGGPGDDALTTGSLLEGGSGSDLLIAFPCRGEEVLGNGGADSISFARSDRGVEAEIGGEARFTSERPGDYCARGSLFPPTRIDDSVESIEGSPGDDVLRGNGARNILLGRGGGDLVAGRGGDDFLVGGLGIDALHGDGGADRLYGRDGARDRALDCGAGEPGDVALTDQVDPPARGCRELGARGG